MSDQSGKCAEHKPAPRPTAWQWHTVIDFNEDDSLTLRNTWVCDLESDAFFFV
ncbi:MAG: hypothetical protein AB3N19_01740 [Ruegeria sp.]